MSSYISQSLQNQSQSASVSSSTQASLASLQSEPLKPGGLQPESLQAEQAMQSQQFFDCLAPAAERIARALADMRSGRPVLLMDDFDRENEVDLIVAAEKISQDSMARMIRDGSGIVCLCIPDTLADYLQLAPMVQDNQSRFSTAFTVSIEAKHGVSTGVSAADRVTTILAAMNDNAMADDLARPGHVFPLRAQAGGVLSRKGHTEGSVDLARLAGLKPAGVLCELMNPDGSMTRGQQILDYALLHDLVILSIDELVQYRQQTGL